MPALMALERDLIDTAITPMEMLSGPDPLPEHQIREGSASADRNEQSRPVSEAPVRGTVISCKVVNLHPCVMARPCCGPGLTPKSAGFELGNHAWRVAIY
jgi:hypothetical protein